MENHLLLTRYSLQSHLQKKDNSPLVLLQCTNLHGTSKFPLLPDNSQLGSIDSGKVELQVTCANPCPSDTEQSTVPKISLINSQKHFVYSFHKPAGSGVKVIVELLVCPPGVSIVTTRSTGTPGGNWSTGRLISGPGPPNKICKVNKLENN